MLLLAFGTAGLGSGCSDCSGGNAVQVAEEVRCVAPTIASVEVFHDIDLDGTISPFEKTFVVDPRPIVDKVVRIEFWNEVDRGLLASGFIEFTSFSLAPEITLDRVYFNDDPNDIDIGGTARVVTYDISDAIDPGLDFPVPVVVFLAMNAIDPTLCPDDPDQTGRFAFVLGRELPADGFPPRVVDFEPSTSDLLGWGRPIETTDFGPGDTLADVLARVDASLLGTTLAERVAPHQPMTATFDRPLSVMLVSTALVSPAPSPGSVVEGIRFFAPAAGFFTTFTSATSSTASGLLPDATYRITFLSNESAAVTPVVTGTQGDQAQFLMPNFSNELLAELMAAPNNYTEQDLALGSTLTIRTGPVRVSFPAHIVGETNATTAPTSGELQFVAPSDGAPAPAVVVVSVTTDSSTTLTTAPFPAGTAQVFAQDGAQVDVTAHTFPLALPTEDFDGVIQLGVEVRSVALEFIGRDEIRFAHDVIVPEVDGDDVTVTNTYDDGQLDELCIVSDCDIDGFIIQVEGGPEVELDASDAVDTECVDGEKQYCFQDVDFGTDVDPEEDELEVTIIGVDDQGNVSDPVTVTVASPECAFYDKFVDGEPGGGERVAVVTLPSGEPAIVESVGDSLVYREAEYGGRWRENRVTIATLSDGDDLIHSFGLGIDMFVDPTDGQPAICFVEGALEETQHEGTGSGTLFVYKRTPAGAWQPIGSRDDARPIGCSLDFYLGELVVAWTTVDFGAPDLPTGLPRWIAVEDLSLPLPVPKRIPTPPLPDPLPPDLPEGADPLTWDLEISGHGAFLFFTYRYPFTHLIGSSLAVGRPGRIAVGYVAPGGVEHVQLLDASSGTGLGPRIAANSSGLVIAHVAYDIEGIDPPSLSEQRGLLMVRADIPIVGDPIEFVLGDIEVVPPFTEDVGPLPNITLQRDGLTTVPSTTNTLVLVPHSRPAMTLLPDGTARIVWAQGNSNPVGTGEIALADWTVDDETTLRVLDSWVGTNLAAGNEEAVAVAIAQGPDGYRVAYRNPLVDRLVFSAEQESPVIAPHGDRECPRLWNDFELNEDELNLTWVEVDFLWDADCVDDLAIDLALPRPFFLAAGEDLRGNYLTGDKQPDRLGLADTLLSELANGLLLQDGRPILEKQMHVCIPRVDPDIFPPLPPGTPPPTFVDTCDPDALSDTDYDPNVELLTVASSDGEPTGAVPPSFLQAYANAAEAHANCPNNGQVLQDLGGTTGTCVVCPEPTWLDPVTLECRDCPDGQKQYTFADAGARLRTLIIGFHDLGCANCPAVDQADLDRGAMAWISTTDGQQCGRCTEGSAPLPCANDAGCDIFGPNARCAGALWGGRNGAPTDSVCVFRCTSDVDCAGGYCDLSDQEGGGADGVPDGICRSSMDDRESVSPLALQCRPIGCEQCWRNDYCETDADCPLNHDCIGVVQEFGEPPTTDVPARAPACILRPVLSPAFEEAFGALLGDTTELDTLREELASTLAKIRIPAQFVLNNFPNVQGFNATISNAHVSLDDTFSIPGTPTRQDRLILTLEFSDGSVHLSSGQDLPFGSWNIEFVFGLGIEPRGACDEPGDDACYAYGGLKAELADLRVNGIEIPGLGSAIAGRLRAQLAPFSGQLFSAILKTLGSLRTPTDGDARTEPGITRCMFTEFSENPGANRSGNLPKECPDESLPDLHLVRAHDSELTVTAEVCR